jgi:hypothetical protein
VKYNANGIVQWANYINGTSADQGNALAVDNSNNVYITGSCNSSTIITLQDVSGTEYRASNHILQAIPLNITYIVKYNPAGIVESVTDLKPYIPYPGTSFSTVGTMISLYGNKLYIAGNYTLSFIFATSYTTFPPTSAAVAIYLAKYSL